MIKLEYHQICLLILVSLSLSPIEASSQSPYAIDKESYLARYYSNLLHIKFFVQQNSFIIYYVKVLASIG